MCKVFAACAQSYIRPGRTPLFSPFRRHLSRAQRRLSNQNDEYPGVLEKKIGQV